jgi:hypothetical protein
VAGEVRLGEQRQSRHAARAGELVQCHVADDAQVEFRDGPLQHGAHARGVAQGFGLTARRLHQPFGSDDQHRLIWRRTFEWHRTKTQNILTGGGYGKAALFAIPILTKAGDGPCRRVTARCLLPRSTFAPTARNHTKLNMVTTSWWPWSVFGQGFLIYVEEISYG